MVTPSTKDPKHLSPLNTSWHNRSMSSISATSEAATFHSAHAHLSNMEMRPLSQPSVLSPPSMTKPLPSPKLESIKMDRQDSGYSDTINTSRRSTSSTRPSGKPKRRTTGSSINSASRPSTKRASRSSVQMRTSTSGVRPSVQSRHTTSFSHSQSSQPYQFFQFPQFHSPDPAPDAAVAPQPPPPATVQYWTSDSTRRLEYAAIDAASKGMKGLLYKLIPDCMVPASSRRTRFACKDGDADSDAGSVRRYRLALPEEKDILSCSSRETFGEGSKKPRMAALRRWTSFGRSR